MLNLSVDMAKSEGLKVCFGLDVFVILCTVHTSQTHNLGAQENRMKKNTIDSLVKVFGDWQNEFLISESGTETCINPCCLFASPGRGVIV